MTTSAVERKLPVAVIGAGPIGLTAAVHLAARGETPLVFEQAERVGASVREWGHVRLFSPWKYLVDPVARASLEATGWTMPDPDGLPTGSELADHLIEPLAALPAIAPHLRTGARVLSVGRFGIDRARSRGRAERPFELVVQRADGAIERILAAAVIDASGTWSQPNPLGAGGTPADGEREHAGRIRYGIPDASGRERARYAGRSILVVGSGHSAFNAVLDLAAVAAEAPATRVVWAIRRAEPGLMFGGGDRDRLAARGSLGARMRALVESGAVRLVTGFGAERLAAAGAGIVVHGAGGAVIGPVDEIVVATGFRPDLALTRELRLRLDDALEAPERLAPLIDPNVHSCGTVYPHGAADLAHPEPGFFTVGMKSYGRAPTFLLLTGYEQVRSVVCALVGDAEGAADVRLVLPETGVCSTDAAGGSACCGAPADGGRGPVANSCGIASACGSERAAGAGVGGNGGGCCR